jgi:hypothetical protein
MLRVSGRISWGVKEIYMAVLCYKQKLIQRDKLIYCEDGDTNFSWKVIDGRIVLRSDLI